MFKNLIIKKTNLNIYLFEFHNALNPSYHLAPDSMSITIIPFMHVNLEPRSFDLGASELRQCIDFEQAIPHLDRSSSSKRSRIHRFDLISVSLNVVPGLCMETVCLGTTAHRLTNWVSSWCKDFQALQCGFLRVTCTITCSSVVLFYYTFLVYVCRNSIFSFFIYRVFSYFSCYYWKLNSLWFIGTRNSTNGTMKLNISLLS